jgi:predicted N-acetyltransferase YhbS
VSVGEISFRAAELSDVVALHELIQHAYRGASAATSWSHEGELAIGERVSVEALSELATSPHCSVIVAELGGRLVGSALVEASEAGRGRIGLLCVPLDAQASGIGGEILRRAEAMSSDRFGSKAVDIEVLEHKAKLLAYYERRGYRRTGRAIPYPHRLSQPATFLVLEKVLG